MTAEQLVGAAGPVEVGGLTFMAQALPVQAEVGLLRRLGAMAKKSLGPGSFYAEALPALDWMAAQGKHGDRAQLMEIVGRLIATKAAVSDEAVDEFRRSPDGVAEELYWRTRKTHPDAAAAEFRAVINDVNALEVHLAMLEATSPKRGAGETPPA